MALQRVWRGRLVGGAVALLAAGAATAQPEAGLDGAALTAAETEFETEMEGAGPNVGQQPRRPWGRQIEGDLESPVVDEETSAEDGGEEEASRLHLWAGVDLATAYVSRGFVWEDTGVVSQPWADVWFDVWRGEAATASLTLGTWSSFHSQATWAGTSDDFREHWYELDLYVGAAVECGAWVFEGRCCWYTSPSDAWETIEEVYLSAALDDSEWLGAWALQPTAIIAMETGDTANDGYENGGYLELGIEPGFGLESLGAGGGLAGVWVSFPTSVGLSLWDYYESEDDDGEYEDVFGYAATGVSVSVPLTGEGGVIAASESWGGWALTAGVQVVWMGEAAASFNEDDEVEVVGMVGVEVGF